PFKDLLRGDLFHVHGRPDCAWRDGIDAYVKVGDLLRDALHEKQDAALRRGIVRMSLPGNEVVYRAHEDQLAGRIGDGAVDPLPLEQADRLAGAQKLARQIYVDY